MSVIRSRLIFGEKIDVENFFPCVRICFYQIIRYLSIIITRLLDYYIEQSGRSSIKIRDELEYEFTLLYELQKFSTIFLKMVLGIAEKIAKQIFYLQI